MTTSDHTIDCKIKTIRLEYGALQLYSKVSGGTPPENQNSNSESVKTPNNPDFTIQDGWVNWNTVTSGVTSFPIQTLSKLFISGGAGPVDPVSPDVSEDGAGNMERHQGKKQPLNNVLTPTFGQ